MQSLILLPINLNQQSISEDLNVTGAFVVRSVSKEFLVKILFVSDRNDISRSSKMTDDIVILYTPFSGLLGRKRRRQMKTK
jgi:hypothetical protein